MLYSLLQMIYSLLQMLCVTGIGEWEEPADSGTPGDSCKT